METEGKGMGMARKVGVYTARIGLGITGSLCVKWFIWQAWPGSSLGVRVAMIGAGAGLIHCVWCYAWGVVRGR